MKIDFGLKTKSAADIAKANKAAAPAQKPTSSTKSSEDTMTATKERKVIGTDHHGHAVFEGREGVGKDDYGRDVFDGQVAIKDAHGNQVFQEPWVGKGPKAGPDNIEGEDDGE